MNKTVAFLFILINCCSSQVSVSINQDRLRYANPSLQIVSATATITQQKARYRNQRLTQSQLQQLEQDIIRYVKAFLIANVPSVKINIGVGDGKLIDTAFDDVQPRLDLETTFQSCFQEYGYSYWFRYLTRYPKPMFEGKNQDWYFMSRLTSNQAYSNIGQGDRLLGLWQGQYGYAFITNDYKTQNWNLVQQIEYGDIEGVWTFMHFSYDSVTKQAVGYIKYSGSNPQSVIFDVTHNSPPYLRFVIGGSDVDKYSTINGQFTSPVFKTGPGSHINTLSKLQQMALDPSPEPAMGYLLNVQQVIISEVKTYQTNQAEIVEYSSDPSVIFPLEYGISGWFRWNPDSMEEWNLAFRLHINKGSDNQDYQRLGDRSLAAWVTTQNDGVFAFDTYSYDGLNGFGNTRMNTNIPLSVERLLNWHFIFFAYNRPLRKAEGFVQFVDATENILIPEVNHFLAAQMYLNVGKDQFYPAWNGDIGKFTLHLGKGASTPSFSTETNIPPEVVTTNTEVSADSTTSEAVADPSTQEAVADPSTSEVVATNSSTSKLPDDNSSVTTSKESSTESTNEKIIDNNVSLIKILIGQTQRQS